MPRTLSALLTLALVLSFGVLSDAEAKRFGGGSSFGGKSSFGSSVKGSTLTPMRTPSQQNAFQQNQNARQSLGNRGGLMRILGGLAIGGLIGSLLFGGAFEHFNLVDMLLVAGVGFVLFRLLRGRGATARPTAAMPGRGAQPLFTPPISGVPAAFDHGLGPAAADSRPPAGPLPAGFDPVAFLAGAKIAYTQLQQAWDSGELAAIRALTTDAMFGELQTRIKDNPTDQATAIDNVQAELIDVVSTPGGTEAVVLFDALLHEGSAEAVQPVREIWHFVQSRSGLSSRWLLDGIQQVED